MTPGFSFRFSHAATQRRNRFFRRVVAPPREHALLEISKIPRFQYERCCNRRSGSRSVTSTFDDHRHRELWSLDRRETEKPAIDPRVLVIHNHFIVLANDITLVVLLDLVPRLHFARLWIINRHDFLRRSRLAA